MSAPPPDGGRWVTPPPMDDGSEVWSSDEYSASTETEYVRPANFSFADYAGRPSWMNPAPTARYVGDGAYLPSANVGYPATYPYYANYLGGSAEALPPYWPQEPGVKRPVDGFAITSFICGVIGAVLFAVGFGVAALRRLARGTNRGRGLALAGLWLSVAWVVAAIVVLYLRS